jgi:Carboxypeptidase regulatory-like domain
MQTRGLIRAALVALVVLLIQGTWALAGTTGNIEGKATDQNGNALTAVKVTATSPSQSGSSVTGSNGFYSILDLSPDTYSVTGTKDGYETTTVYGITVTADQSTAADLHMKTAIKTIGRITTTATATVVSKTVTGDLYAVNAQAISNLQGSTGGSETLYSQNAIAGSMPGVFRQVGTGGGYAGQGTLSMRGGSFDQIGFELEGIPLNRGFDFYNSTSGLTNGLSSLEVYTGGAPADAGRAMSGYVNEVVNRGKYPGGGDFTVLDGSPIFNHSVQADIYGGTPDNRFTYYVSTLALNSDYNFGGRNNLVNTAISVPANDPGCNAWNAHALFGVPGFTIPALTGAPYLNCSVANSLSQPQSLATYADIPYTAQRDTVTNLHWTLAHNGLNDDLQALYVVGSTISAPYAPEGTFNSDPNVSTFTSNTGYNPATGQLLWPTGSFYYGKVGQPYTGSMLTPLTWPTSGGSLGGPIPATFQDSQNTQYSISKISYTRSLNSNSFLRLYEYNLFSFWSLDQPINGWVGFTFYQLHDNATGVTLDYQNQMSAQNLLKIDGDWTRDLTLRYNYQPAFNFWSTGVGCSSGGAPAACGPGSTVSYVGSPFGYWSSTTPLTWDGVLDDQFKASDKFLLDAGARWDEFRFVLMPDMQLTGTNGLAYEAEEEDGQCLHGFAYSPSDPAVIGPDGNQNCYDILQPGGTDPGTGAPLSAKDLVGVGAWSNPPTSISYEAISPRGGFTYSFDPTNIIRASVGRYVQPPDSAFEEYRENPVWGPGDTVQLLNRFYDGLGFYTVHNVQPENSTNYDFSYEHDFGAGLSMKLSPFYRDTQNQILNLPVNPASPSFVTGYNFGNAHVSGLEFLVNRAVTTATGIGGSLGATFTNSTIRFWKGPSGASYIDTVNSQIASYNAYYGTHYAMLDPNEYYPPSYDQAPPVSPSYDVRFILNLTLDARAAGFDVVPTLNYQSGQPYGDPQLFTDPHCAAPGAPGTDGNAPGCTPLPAGVLTAQGGIGPDPYTNQFDAPGAFKGPSWWALNLGVSHNIGQNMKASILGTNLLWGIHNQGYPWELPTSEGVISYADNPFYDVSPLGLTALTGCGCAAHPANAYYGDDYYGYAPASAALAGGGAIPYRTYIFSVSAKI